MIHSDLFIAPVDLGVVFHKPCVAKDDSHLPDTGDVEGGSLQVTLVLDDEVHNLSNVACVKILDK